MQKKLPFSSRTFKLCYSVFEQVTDFMLPFLNPSNLPKATVSSQCSSHARGRTRSKMQLAAPWEAEDLSVSSSLSLLRS